MKIDSKLKSSPHRSPSSSSILDDDDDDDDIIAAVTLEMKSSAIDELARASPMKAGHVNGHMSPSNGECV